VAQRDVEPVDVHLGQPERPPGHGGRREVVLGPCASQHDGGEVGGAARLRFGEAQRLPGVLAGRFSHIAKSRGIRQLRRQPTVSVASGTPP
jgi:hypothetical protein